MNPDALKTKHRSKLFRFEDLCGNLCNNNFVRHQYTELKSDRIICHLIFKDGDKFYEWEYSRSLFDDQDIIFESNSILCHEVKRVNSIRYEHEYIIGKNEISKEYIEKMLLDEEYEDLK